MTVLRCFSDPDKVSPKTLAKVMAAAQQLGYVPNSIAGSLKRSRSDIAVMLVPSLENSLFAPTIKGVSEVLRAANCELIVSDTGYDPIEEERSVSRLLSRRPSGFILHSTNHTQNCLNLLRRSGVPVVETGDLTAMPIDSTVSFSNESASNAVVSYLVDKGYKKIAFFGLQLDSNSRVQGRREGYRRALEQGGISPDPSLEFTVPAGFASSGRAISELIESRPEVDAVFCSGDVHALGVLLECHRKGWKVPDRLAVAGFDDHHELAEQFVPALTSVSIPRRSIGRLAAELVLKRMNDGNSPSQVIDVGFELMVRETT